MVALDMQPVSIVEDLGFLKFLRALDPRYQPPSRKTLSHSIIPQKYEEMKRKLLGELEKLKYCALTTDIWTSRQTMGYITITCHYIDSSWSLHSVILITTNMQKDHTAESIADELKAATDEWGITQKIVAVVTDNAANIVAAVCLNGWKHVPCFAHDALKDDPVLSDISKKCRDIVTYFHRSCKAAERLCEIQTRFGLECHKLINDVQTRWNSTFFMFDGLLSKMKLYYTLFIK